MSAYLGVCFSSAGRTSLTLLLAVLWASSATAATLTLTSLSGPGPFFPGETITLELGGDSLGVPDESFASAAIEFGGEGSALAIEPSYIGVHDVDWFTTQAVTPIPTPGTSGQCSFRRCRSTPGSTDGHHRVINLVDPTFGFYPFDIFPGSVMGRVQFVMGRPGVYSFTPIGDDHDIGWFGVTDVEPLNVTVIPEPTTSGLLAAGLVALAIRRRRGTTRRQHECL